MSAYPESRSELFWMSACYVLTTVLGCMALFPHEVAHFLMGLLP